MGRRGGARGPRALRVPPLLADALDGEPVPLSGFVPPSASLRVAVVISSRLQRGGVAGRTIVELVRDLEALGHEVSWWLVDKDGSFPETFEGADVALATSWQTVFAVLRLPGCGARARLVLDHEPELFATSIERSWAEWTYRQGVHAICASQWLAELVATRYGSMTSTFDPGVDHDCFRPLPTHRRDDLVLFYAPPSAPRHAVPLGALALAELHRRRPEVEIALFGDARGLRTPFPHRHLGVLEPNALAHAYASAAVGVVLSLTNPSVVASEMLACGLPVVDLAVPSTLSTFGTNGPITLATPEPTALTEAIESLLDDLELRATRTRAGLDFTATRTRPAAAQQVESGLRDALRRAGE